MEACSHSRDGSGRPVATLGFWSGGSMNIGNRVTRAMRRVGACAIAVVITPSMATAQDIVLLGSSSTTRVGKWTVASDSGASTGSVIKHPDAGAAKITSPRANPVDYFELSFTASAGQP